MIAVARIHFPDLSENHLEWIVRHVRAFQGSVLSCIENIAMLSRIFAEEDGRTSLKLADIKQAISDCLPTRTPAAPTPEESAPLGSGDAIAPEADDEARPAPIFRRNAGNRNGSLLRLENPSDTQKNRIEDPTLVLAD